MFSIFRKKVLKQTLHSFSVPIKHYSLLVQVLHMYLRSLGRLDDIGQDGMALIGTIANIFQIHDIKAEIIAASIRSPQHITDAALTVRILQQLHLMY